MLLKRISDSKKLAALQTDGARLLYTWLMSHLDVNGCYSASPDVVKGKVFTRLRTPVTKVAAYLDDLERVDLIRRYEENGDWYLWFPDFVDKQPSLRPEREASIVPPPPAEVRQRSGATPAEVPQKLREGKGREVNGKEDKLTQSPPHPDIRVAQKRAAVTDPRIKELIDYHFDTYENNCGEKYVVVGGKDGMAFKRLLAELDRHGCPDPVGKVKRLIDRYFESKDPFIRESGYTITLFVTQVNKLQRAMTAPQSHQPKSWGTLQGMMNELRGGPPPGGAA